MKAKDARQAVDRALGQLSDALASGHSEALVAYLAAMSRFSTYSAGNLLLILVQRPDATRVAGFRAWQKLGRHVKRGEKGILITAPVVVRVDNQEARPRGPPASESQRALRGFKPAYVFDMLQTEGKPLPEPARASGDPNGHTKRLIAFIAANGIKIERSSDLHSADGLSCGGRIVLREGLAPAEEFSVAVHEFAHELLHRTDRQMKLSKTAKETEAEAVAFVVSHAIGLDTTAASSDYIQLYSGDRKMLSESLDRIQKTAARILEAITSDY